MSDSNDITVLNPGLYKNLLAQVESIYKHSNELSFKTRARYYEATKRFCKFLANNFRLQNFKNVEDRHFKAYVEHLKENNSAATIQSDLSGIRYFHRKSGSKNRLSPNSKLNLPKRATGVKDHSLLDILFTVSFTMFVFSSRDKNKSNENNGLYFADTYCLYEYCLCNILS